MVAGQMRPPFAPGNTLSLVHGAESERTIAARAAEVRDRLLEVAPELAEPRFLPAVDLYLKAVARADLLDAYVTKVSAEEGPHKVPQRVWEAATAAARLAGQLGDKLALSPEGYGRVKLLLHAAEAPEERRQRLADLAATGRALRESREATGA